MNTVYTVLGVITFYSIIAYLVYEFVYPYARASVEAVKFLSWYDREAKRVNPEHVYKIGPVARYISAFGQMLDRYKEARCGVTTKITHHSGAVYK